MILGAILCVLAVSAQEPVTRYDDNAILRVTVKQADDFPALMKYADDNSLDVWKIDQSGLVPVVDIRVDPTQKSGLQSEIVRLGANAEMYVSDIQALIEASSMLVNTSSTDEPNDPFFDNYRRYNDIRAKTQELAGRRADAVFIPSIGRTIEGREIFAIRFGGRNPGPVGRRAVYLQGGIHAREWISPASVMYILDSLVTSTDPAIVRLTQQLEFVVVPLLNADGYEWTHTNTRLWRKNRRINSGSTCIGVDLNRNWDDHWGGGGSSPNPCADTYRGTRASSEPETEAVVNFLMNTINRETRLIGGIDYHAFGQLILRPYGWCLPRDGVPENNQEMQTLGANMRQAIISTTGTTYSNEHSAQLYIAAGGADDWFYSVATGRRIAYCIEARDTGRFGFLLPPDQIRPTGSELLAATLVFANHALARPN